MKKSAEARLSRIAEEVEVCQLCPLAKFRTKAVPGEGDASSRVMFVGEAPGREEDLTGRPFVGRSGKLLTSVLEDLGVGREEVYITSVVKCRPPRNRVPKRSETDTCVDAHLKRQMEAIRPRVVVLLGRTATAKIRGASTLKEVRGKLVKEGGVTYLSTFHPAAILRNPRLKGTFEKDLKLALSARAPRGRFRNPPP